MCFTVDPWRATLHRILGHGEVSGATFRYLIIAFLQILFLMPIDLAHKNVIPLHWGYTREKKVSRT
jgi:hypothetical protein